MIVKLSANFENELNKEKTWTLFIKKIEHFANI